VTLSNNTRNVFTRLQTLLRARVMSMKRGGKKAGKKQLLEQ
jgi:hypothetical protein